MITNQPNQVQMIKKIENYVFNLGNKIGEGSFSQVFKGADIMTNRSVAVKKVRIGNIKSKISRRLLECEISILKIVNHKNIIKCLDVHSSINNCYIITELCDGGDLDSMLRIRTRFMEKDIAKILYQVFQALEYLSHLGIIHRDLKVSNIFMHESQFKLADFGFAIRANANFKDIAIGSPVYMSPEGLINNFYGPKTDVWSFGILIYELLHGVTPLASCKTEQELRKRVLQAPQITFPMSNDLRQLMMNCLKINEKQRYTVNQIGESTYIKKIRQELGEIIDIQKDLNMTISTMGSGSDKIITNFPEISIQTAVGLIHFCRFLSKICTLTPSNIFSRCLVWLSVNLKRAKIESNKLTPQKQYNIKNLIKEFNEQFLTVHMMDIPKDVNFQEIISECEKLSQKILPKYSQHLKNLARESDLLMKCFEYECMQQFCKKSKAKQYASSMPIRE